MPKRSARKGPLPSVASSIPSASRASSQPSTSSAATQSHWGGKPKSNGNRGQANKPTSKPRTNWTPKYVQDPGPSASAVGMPVMWGTGGLPVNPQMLGLPGVPQWSGNSSASPMIITTTTYVMVGPQTQIQAPMPVSNWTSMPMVPSATHQAPSPRKGKGKARKAITGGQRMIEYPNSR